MASEEEITLICIGPVTNIKAALEREPRIVEKARFVGMHGAVYKGYGNQKPDREYNVVHDVPACQAALSAGWDITITPLDTCGNIHLTNERYRIIRESELPTLKALMENYYIWMSDNKDRDKIIETRSSTLFDLVAIYLGLSEDLCVMKDLPIIVTKEGRTVVEENAKPMHVAVEWKDLDAFHDWCVQRLLGE